MVSKAIDVERGAKEMAHFNSPEKPTKSAKLSQVCAPIPKTSIKCLIDSIIWEPWLLISQQTLSKAQCLLSSLCSFSNSPRCFGRSLFPLPSFHALFTVMFTGFLPSCAWSIKHTCTLAPSPLHPRLAPEAKPGAPAELIKWHRWMAFSKLGRKLL